MGGEGESKGTQENMTEEGGRKGKRRGTKRREGGRRGGRKRSEGDTGGRERGWGSEGK